MSLKQKHETVEHKILHGLAHLGMYLFDVTAKAYIRNKLTEKDIKEIRQLLQEIEETLP